MVVVIIACMDMRNNEEIDRLLKRYPGAIVLRDGGGNPAPLMEDLKKLAENGNITEVIMMGHRDCGWVKIAAGALYFGDRVSAELRAEYADVFKDFRPGVNLKKVKTDAEARKRLYSRMEVHALNEFRKTIQSAFEGVKVTPMRYDTPNDSRTDKLEGEHTMVIVPPSSAHTAEIAAEVASMLRRNGMGFVVDVDKDLMYVVSSSAMRHAELADKNAPDRPAWAPRVHIANIVIVGNNREALEKAQEAIKKVTRVPTEIAVRERRKSRT